MKNLNSAIGFTEVLPRVYQWTDSLAHDLALARGTMSHSKTLFLIRSKSTIKIKKEPTTHTEKGEQGNLCE
jgi:hypothetical protein